MHLFCIWFHIVSFNWLRILHRICCLPARMYELIQNCNCFINWNCLQECVVCRCINSNRTTQQTCCISYWCIYVSIAQWTAAFTQSETASQSTCCSRPFSNENAVNSGTICWTENQVCYIFLKVLSCFCFFSDDLFLLFFTEVMHYWVW